MIKKTFLEIRIIDEIIGLIGNKNPKLVDSKFAYAYKRFYEKNLKRIFRDYQDALLGVRIDCALEDKNTKQILRDANDQRHGGFAYSKEDLKRVVQEENRIIDEYEQKEFEIEPYICSQIPEELSDEQKEILNGVLIKL